MGAGASIAHELSAASITGANYRHKTSGGAPHTSGLRAPGAVESKYNEMAEHLRDVSDAVR